MQHLRLRAEALREVGTVELLVLQCRSRPLLDFSLDNQAQIRLGQLLRHRFLTTANNSASDPLSSHARLRLINKGYCFGIVDGRQCRAERGHRDPVSGLDRGGQILAQNGTHALGH